MSGHGIPPQLKITMLRQLVAGRNLDWVAAAAEISRDQVLDVVSAHGYPDHDRMGWAIDMLTQDTNKIPQRASSTVRAGRPLDPPAVLPRPPQPPPPPAVQRIPAHTPTAELLHQANESAYARTRALGAKISGLLTDLTVRLADEQAARDAEVKQEKEQAAVKARIAELEAELTKLKGKRSKPAETRNITQPRAPGAFPCTSCDRTFQSPHGLGVHKGRSHQAAVAS